MAEVVGHMPANTQFDPPIVSERSTPSPPIAARTVVQRQSDPLEEEADAIAHAAVSAGPVAPVVDLSGGEEDELALIQAKADPASGAGALDDAAIRNEIDGRRGSGEPLSAEARAPAEAALGADLAGVRVHRDNSADRLSRSMDARAFTTGSDIFFRAGQFDPSGTEGRKLLAHELTHVVQQNPGVAAKPVAHSSTPSPIQRQEAEEDTPAAEQEQAAGPEAQAAETTLVGALRYFDEKDTLLGTANLHRGALDPRNLAPGLFEVTLTQTDTGWGFELNGQRFTADPTTPDALALERTWFQGTQNGGRVLLQIGFGAPDTKSEGKVGTTGTVEPQEGTEGGRAGGAGGTGKTGTPRPTGAKPGSKYGFLGLYSLPVPLIQFLESAIDALGDSQEFQSLRDTLDALKTLHTHLGEIQELFKDGDALLDVALGLKESAAVDALATWALQAPPRIRDAQEPTRSNVVRMARKLAALLAKVRRILQPVFKVRAAVQASVAGVALTLTELESFEFLLESLNVAPGSADRAVIAENIAGELAEAIRPKLAEARDGLKAAAEKFLADDFVSYQEIAAVVLSAMTVVAPKQYKGALRRALQTGLAKDLVDQVVTPLIPKEVVDGINSRLRTVAENFAPVIEEAQASFDNIVNGLNEGLVSQLPSALAQLSPESAQSDRTGVSAGRVAGLVRESRSEPLGDAVAEDMSQRTGLSLPEVEVHRDAPAERAAEALHAKAFTIGTHVFFGPGRYAPAAPTGRHLLAHELTHVVQQNGATAQHGLQPDWKERLDRLAKRYSDRVIAELKGARAPTAAKRDQAAKIKEQVDKLIGRKVVSVNNPKLPPGYFYVRKKGQIATIRRRLDMIAFIPALTIDPKTRTIKLAALLQSFDPNAAARAALRRAMGCSSTQQAHHVIPLELKNNPVVELAIANGWALNGAANGVCISSKVHKGPHDTYTTDVRRELGKLRDRFGGDWNALEAPFHELVGRFKTRALRARALK